MLNPGVEQKFLEVLTAIRNKDPKLKEVKEDDCIFKDDDFDRNKTTGKKEKGVFLKDQIRDHALKKMKKKTEDGSDSSSDSSSDGEDQDANNDRRPAKESKLFEKIGVPYTEQEHMDKEEFMQKAFVDDGEGSEDDFLKQKPKGAETDSDEESDKDEGKKKDRKKPQEAEQKEMKLVTDTELLSRFYGKESELDEGEKFLRNYILHEGWKAGG